jgi:hypothetical protein
MNPNSSIVDRDRDGDRGLTCDDCGILVSLLINCAGCVYVVCKPCYTQQHANHRSGVYYTQESHGELI